MNNARVKRIANLRSGIEEFMDTPHVKELQATVKDLASQGVDVRQALREMFERLEFPPDIIEGCIDMAERPDEVRMECLIVERAEMELAAAHPKRRKRKPGC